METIYRTKAIHLESGERFPLLVDRQTEVPVLNVVDYSLAYHRTISINSGKSRVGAIGLLLEWAEECLIDIDERFGSGDLFSQAEIENLATALGQSKRKKVVVGDQVLPGNVLGDTQANRVDWVTDYIRWRTTAVAQAMKINDPRVLAINQRLQQIEKQLKNLKRKGGGKVRLGLTEEQQVRLFEIVRPDSPENPFYAETRYRNFMLFLLFYELGIRRAESLVLKANHIDVHQNPRIIIEPNPGDPDDPRKDQPLVKTAGRTLPISSLLAQTIHTYITKHRSKVPGAKKSPFIVLDKPLKVSARRFRYTLATRAIDNGASAYEVADALDHSDLQNVGVYFDVHSNIVTHIDQAVAMALAPRAQAFAKLVEREDDAERGDQHGSRCYYGDRERDIVEPVGTCGNHSFCNISAAPLACYTCPMFQPWMDGPHDLVLDGLLRDREKKSELGLNPKMVAINDHVIIEVAGVIQRIADKRSKQDG